MLILYICDFFIIFILLSPFFSIHTFFGHNIIIKEDNKIPLIERYTFICSLYINLLSWHIMCGVWMSMRQQKKIWKTTLVGGETCKMHLQTFRRLNIWFYFQFFLLPFFFCFDLTDWLAVAFKETLTYFFFLHREEIFKLWCRLILNAHQVSLVLLNFRT